MSQQNPLHTQSRLAAALGLQHRPVAIVLTDTKPESASQFKAGSWGCVAAMLRTASKGRTVVFDRQTSGCAGGGTGLGFGNCYEDFPIAKLLSTGGKALAQGRDYDMGEGERYFASPELAERWAQTLPYREVPTEFIVCKALDQIVEAENVSLVWMMVNPDQLSALVTLAGFRHGSSNASVAPWGAACQSILFAFAEAEQDPPRAVIGGFDISQRGKSGKELLTYTLPYRMFCEMEASVDASFLSTSTWHKLRERWL